MLSEEIFKLIYEDDGKIFEENNTPTIPQATNHTTTVCRRMLWNDYK